MPTDVKLLESQRLTDNPDGGGLMTSNEIEDGVINNLFADISDIDRVNGRISLRKAYAIALTDDTALYAGAHAIISQPPEDERVSALLFSTGSWSDERDDARAAIERYLDESVISPMVPYDRQLAGQLTVLVFQRPELSLPEIGDVFVLSRQSTGQTEFVRIVNMTHEVQPSTDAVAPTQTFNVRVITLTISQPLSQEFAGSQPNRYFTAGSNTQMRKSVVSDAARYRGIVPVGVDADVGALTVKLGSVYGQLIPAAQQESGILDALPAGSTLMVAASEATVSFSQGGSAWSGTVLLYTGTGILPGTLIAQRDLNGWNRSDDGLGNIVDHLAGDEIIGYVDYETGLLTLLQGPTSSHQWNANTRTFTWTPAVSVARSSITAQQRITIGTRGLIYTATLRPVPEPGTLVVSYRALGRWYELRDDGTRALVGAPGTGVGLVNYATGGVSVTLGALPDIGSSIIFAWGGSSDYEIRTGDTDVLPPRVDHDLESGNCEPGTLTVTWESGAVEKTATDDGEGNITGDALGRVVYATGEVSIRPTLMPNDNTLFTYDYEAASVETELFNPSKDGATITMTVANAPIRPRSLLITYQQGGSTHRVNFTTTQQLTDNGAGELVDAAGQIKAGSVVNYATGEISFNPDFTMLTPVLNYQGFVDRIPARVADPSTGYFAAIASFGRWPVTCANQIGSVGFINGTNVTVQYKQDGATDGVEQDQIPAPPLLIDLTPRVVNTVVPGGVRFTFGGRTYVDREGSLLYGVGAATNAGSTGGTINYQTGVCTITAWAGGASTAFGVSGLLTQVRPLPVAQLTGRTPGAPIRPGSFQARATRWDGELIMATADSNGNIESGDMHGYVDVSTGVFAIAFGQYVLDSGLSEDDKAEPWYDAAAVAEGWIFRPVEIVPGTFRFNCVVQIALPLSPELIGVNPVRLPQDGRVQTVRAGETLVFHDTQATTVPDELVADQVIELPRGDLAAAVLADQEGVLVDAALYTVDLVEGEITMANPLDLAAYTEPLVCTHRIEDMVLCTDAQITGEVAVSTPLTHGYTAANSWCSVAQIMGDLQARYQSLFALQTWVGNWDATEGTPPSSGAQYNDLTYPLQILNRDAITQRWRLQFTSSTAFNIVGEDLGIVGTGNTSTNVAPVNPGTGQPYFVMDSAGFGTGWASGHAIRFNTVGAGAPLWIARTVLSGPVTQIDDQFRLMLRYNKD